MTDPREVVLPEGVPGRLLLHAMPGRWESWAEFLAAARRERVTDLVCLAPREEVAALSPQYAEALRAPAALPFARHELPLIDFGVPGDPEHFRAALAALAARLRAGAVVLLHCGAGIGRTGTTAACLLRELGLDTDAALGRVRAAGSGPENELQERFVAAYPAAE